MSTDTETIDKLFLELSQFTKAKTAREIYLEQSIRNIVNAKSWEAQAALAEVILAEIEGRPAEQFATDYLNSEGSSQ